MEPLPPALPPRQIRCVQGVVRKRQHTRAIGAGERGIARRNAEGTTGWCIKASVFKDLGVRHAARTIRRCGVTGVIAWRTAVGHAGARIVANIRQGATVDGRITRRKHWKVGLRRSTCRVCAEKGLWGRRREHRKQKSARSAATPRVLGSQSLAHCLVKGSSKMLKDNTGTH